jgi:hypothetical protein
MTDRVSWPLLVRFCLMPCAPQWVSRPLRLRGKNSGTSHRSQHVERIARH